MTQEIQYPIKLRTTYGFLYELYHCEYGRWEDAQEAREAGDTDAIEANDYQVVACDFLDRHRDLKWEPDHRTSGDMVLIEAKSDSELCELYYALASGTIGLYASRTANKLLDQIRDKVQVLDPELVKMWPCQSGA